jgi:hypothetical protein
MSAKTIAALQQLDPQNENHWTSDGLPRLETVRLLAGDSALTREAVTSALPGFTRTSAVASKPPAQAAMQPTGEQGTGDPVTAAPAAAQPGAEQGSSNVSADTAAGSGGDNGLDDIEAQPVASGLEVQVEAAQQRFEDASTKKAQADKEHQQATAELDAARVAADRARPPSAFPDQLRAYHARQLALLQERGEQKRRLKEAGINLKDLIPSRAPIDAAFARKNTRGTQRPMHPKK